jgi:hypothetical protein
MTKFPPLLGFVGRKGDEPDTAMPTILHPWGRGARSDGSSYPNLQLSDKQGFAGVFTH